MSELKHAEAEMTAKTQAAYSPSRTPAPSSSGFSVADIKGAAGNMATQHATREKGGEGAAVRLTKMYEHVRTHFARMDRLGGLLAQNKRDALTRFQMATDAAYNKEAE